jgi:hypothetical protein
MTATPQDYIVGTSAALKIIQADIASDVPAFFQSDIPPGLPAQVAEQIAKAVIDAVDAARNSL